jgi:hypothetical protein
VTIVFIHNRCLRRLKKLLTQLAALALVTNVFLLHPVLFIEYTPNPLYSETGLKPQEYLLS